MATKPTIGNSRWDTDGTNMTAPSSGQRDTGIVASAAAVSSYINYLLNQAYNWFLYLDDGILAGKFGFGTAISPSTISGTVNDYNPTSLSTAAVIRQDLTAETTLNGLAGGETSRVVVIVNIDASFNLFLANEAGGSSAANRFVLPDSVTYRLRPGQSAILRFDTTANRWRLIGGTGRSQQTTIMAGSAFLPLTETADFLKPGGGTFLVNTTSQTAQLPLNFPVGTYIESVVAKVLTSGNAGNRILTLLGGAWDGTSASSLASHTLTTISTTITLTAGTTSGAVPQTTAADTRYFLSLLHQTDDETFSVKVVHYPP